MQRFLGLMLWVGVILIIGCHCDELLEITVDDQGNLVDTQGRVRLFHGFNSVVKHPPYYDEQAYNETKLKIFKELGMNVIRLGVIWTAVVPKQGVVDKSYLDKLEMIVDKCAEYGIYVFLDMHQDGLSTRFGSYDAIPPWLIEILPKPPVIFDYPFPFLWKPKSWFLTYVTYATEDCAQNLYNNASGAWIHWAHFWRTVVQRFKDKPNVLGYELINEPPPGNFFKHPSLILPGEFKTIWITSIPLYLSPTALHVLMNIISRYYVLLSSVFESTLSVLIRLNSLTALQW